ncbi:MAG: zinc-dependent peptidase [Steroidobacteraceae bacterium]|nr:zinc-dependent peptidase [Steroidobacteraceae bacterium]
MPWPWLLLVAASALALAALLASHRRRTRIRSVRTLEPAARNLLEARVPLFRRVPPGLRPELEHRIRDWLEHVEFLGCGGLAVRDDMRLVIASQACITALGLGRDAFDRLRGVNLYPDEFWVEEHEVDEETGVVTEGGRALSGQTVATDRIVLSWRDVEEAAARQDGYNVVVHEAVHYLDHAAGGRASSQGGALAAEYQALCEAVDRGEETLIDPYGAEDPVEFLAVAAELFFEQPRRLRRRHGALYAALRDAFRLDPAEWPPPHAGSAPPTAPA